tara:strand:+ start:10093 stop:10686 length:594 start_codon:yes stop_codon:yes gene_type:complete
MRYLPEYFDSDNLYFLMDGFLMLGVSFYIFNKSEKTVLNMFFTTACIIIFLHNIVDCMQMMILQKDSFDVFNYFSTTSIVLIFYILIFRNRYKWEKMKGNNYDRNKIQRIYSKPNMVLTLLGAATSLSPKCSVRYTYNDKTIRFKRGSKTPIICDTIIKKTDIIEDTNLSGDYFNVRWEEIKDKKYNLLTFNCRRLF